jgi:hypothetical protein
MAICTLYFKQKHHTVHMYLASGHAKAACYVDPMFESVAEFKDP